MECIFCKIARKEIPAQVIYEDMHAVGFLDRDPRAAGHTLIVPKRHAETILDLQGGEVGTLFSAVREITALLKKSLHADGFTIGINHGVVAGQAVSHLHVHVIPRFMGDHGTSIHAVITNPPAESVEAIAKKIMALN